MLFVLVLSSSVALVAFAGVGLSGQMSNAQAKAANSAEDRWVMIGAEQSAKSDVLAKRLTLGASKTYTIGKTSILATVLDNSSAMPNTVKIVLSGNADGRAISSTEVIALSKPIVTTIWSHGIYSNSNYTWPAASNVNGSVFFRNSISVLATGGIVSQDFKTCSLFNPMGLIKVNGAILTGMQAYQWPTLNSTTYTSKASSTLAGNQTLSGYTFPTDNALVVVNGNLTLTNAQITRSGTFYVTGSVTIDKVVRAKSSDHIAIICANNITFANGSKTVNAEGYFFAGGTISVNSPLSLNGAMIGNGFSGTSSVNVTWDPWIMADPANGQALKAPVLWP